MSYNVAKADELMKWSKKNKLPLWKDKKYKL